MEVRAELSPPTGSRLWLVTEPPEPPRGCLIAQQRDWLMSGCPQCLHGHYLFCCISSFTTQLTKSSRSILPSGSNRQKMDSIYHTQWDGLFKEDMWCWISAACFYFVGPGRTGLHTFNVKKNTLLFSYGASLQHPLSLCLKRSVLAPEWDIWHLFNLWWELNMRITCRAGR